MLAGPLLEKVIFQLHEIDWHPKDTTLPLEYRKSVHEALTSLTGQFESLIGVIGSVGAINSVLLLDSGNGPVISTTVGAAVNLLIALLANVGMHMSTNAATAYDHFRNDDEKDGDKSLKSMASRSRPFFALAGTLGLGSVVSAATTGMTQYKGTDDKTKWLIGSYIPTLVALYLLGSSLLQMTLQMHRAPGPFIKAKAYAP